MIKFSFRVGELHNWSVFTLYPTLRIPRECRVEPPPSLAQSHECISSIYAPLGKCNIPSKVILRSVNMPGKKKSLHVRKNVWHKAWKSESFHINKIAILTGNCVIFKVIHGNYKLSSMSSPYRLPIFIPRWYLFKFSFRNRIRNRINL